MHDLVYPHCSRRPKDAASASTEGLAAVVPVLPGSGMQANPCWAGTDRRSLASGLYPIGLTLEKRPSVGYLSILKCCLFAIRKPFPGPGMSEMVAIGRSVIGDAAIRGIDRDQH